MNFNLPTSKPYDDPLFSTNTTELHNQGYDCFMFVWDIFREKPSVRLKENLAELGPLSIAHTLEENIDRIVDDFVPYNFGFIKVIDEFTEEGRTSRSFTYPESRYKNLRKGLELIFTACTAGVFDHEIEKDVPEDRQHFSILFNIFVQPAEEGRTIFDIKEGDGKFPIYNEAISVFGHYALITYQKGKEQEFDIKPIDLTSIGLPKTFF